MASEIYDPEADQRKYNFWTRTDAPQKAYCILFTPRSGSSWLTSVLTATRAMGTPSEWFNPKLMVSSTRSKGARNLDQFVEAISRHETHGNIFGFEVTHHQLNAVFGDDRNFMSRFGDATFFWLIRKDIVAQGISLQKMVQTNVGHSKDSDRAAIAESDARHVYDAGDIKGWINHIRAAEIKTEAMISAYNLPPVRLSYEGITSAGAGRVARSFADALGVTLTDQAELASDHHKIGTDKNDKFAERFRAENAAFVAKLEASRAAMVARHA